MQIKIATILVLGIFLISLTSAGLLDVKKEFNEIDSFVLNKKVIEYNSIWEEYAPIEINSWLGLGETLFSGAIVEHTNTCGLDCSSTMEVYLSKEGILVDEVIFKTLQENGKWIEQDIKEYNLEYLGIVDDYEWVCVDGEKIIYENKTEYYKQICDYEKVGEYEGWINYDEGSIVSEGEYTLRLVGKKKSSRTVDWIIKTQEKTLDSWAVWGNISAGDDAEVILHSPEEHFLIDYGEGESNLITFNASFNITLEDIGSSNMSLWTNESGTWEQNNFTNISESVGLPYSDSIIPYNDSLISYYKFDDASGDIIDSKSGINITQNTGVSYGVDGKIIDALDFERSQVDYLQTSFYSNITNYTICFWFKEETPTGDTWLLGRILPSVHWYINIAATNKISFASGGGLGATSSVISRDTEWHHLCVVGNLTGKKLYHDGIKILDSPNTTDGSGNSSFYIGRYGSYTDDSFDGQIDEFLVFDRVVSDEEVLLIVGSGKQEYTQTWNRTYNYSTSFSWNVQACDDEGDCGFAPQNRTVEWKIFQNNISFSESTFETKQETFEVDVSANTSLTAVALDYNGTEYSTTKSGDIYSKTIDIPVGVQNRSFRWKFTYAGETIYSGYSYQYVNETKFNICNATYTDDYLNISFKDESTLANINGTIQTSTFVYYLGSGISNKTYTYTDSGNATNYKFCAIPNQTLYVDTYVNYLGDGYPNRIYEPTILTLNTTVTEKTLYLLSSSDGIYVTFVTATAYNTAISGVDITISRTISGDSTTVSQGTTDSAGSFTAWLNPNYDHTIVATKVGYTTNTQTVRPTQTSYTLVMSTGADAYTYVSDYAGLKWFVFPGVGIRNSTASTDFGFNITANDDNLVNCKIELLNEDKTSVLASAESASSDGSSCEVLVAYSMSSTYPKVKGRLLVDIGEGYQLLEDDAYWAFLEFNSTGMTFTDWFNGLKTGDLTYFNNDEQHREYTHILLFFLFVMIVCAVLNIAGWDIQNQGGMIFLVGTLVWIASIPGFLTLSNISPFVWIDKFFVAGVYSLFMIGYATRSFT